MKAHGNPIRPLLVWSVRGYQRFISPALPRSCKYYPSCSQYAVDALTQYGVLRGVVLAAWRLLRCNPLSYGGYDPIERQTLFGRRDGDDRRAKTGGLVRAVHAGKAGVPLIAILLVAVFLLMPLSASSCGSPGSADTTAGATSSVTDTVSTATETTTTTVEAQQDPGSFDRVTKPLQALFFAVLDFLHEHLRVSWSWAIVLLTVIVRIVLIPLTWRQIKSMRAMQALQPQVKALQAKYKEDRQLLNQKMMEFYRENKVSPFGSCLPLVLQLPVFLGLFYMLRTAGKPGLDPAEWGRWASIFVDPQVGWLWISDITTFDIGLMFLYIGSQFVASWQMSRKGAGQQKIIAYVMPVMIGVFMFIYKWPAGLFIYWFTSNLWTIAQQYAAEKIVPVPVAVVPEPVKEKTTRARPTGQTPARSSGKTPGRPAGKTSARPAGKSGGKTSGEKTGQKGKATGSSSQRPNRGDGGPKSSS